MEKTVAKGSFRGSRPMNRGGHANGEITIEELIAKIKFKRTVRRLIKLIRSR